MFAPYSFDIPFDADLFLKQIPDDATGRGMFFTTIQKLLTARGKKPLEGKWIPFKSYPRREYMRHAFDAATQLGATVPEGLYEIGRSMYVDFAGSLIGKTIFMVAKPTFVQLCTLAPRGYAVSNNYGELRVVELDDSAAHFAFEGVWDPPHLSAGLLRGVMDATGVKLDSLLYKSSGPAHLEFKVQYSMTK